MQISIPQALGDYEGWFLTGLSSAMCILGASTIFLDVLVKKINPHSNFDIKSNDSFLIMGFSLSSGSLIYTSLYKLLPKATRYFAELRKGGDGEEGSSDNDKTASLKVLFWFNVGVAVCFSLNYVIHHFASESVVHCNHGGGDEESQINADDDDDDDVHHHHEHAHGHHAHGHHSQSHSHSHSNSELSTTSSYSHDHSDNNIVVHDGYNRVTETTPLVMPPPIKKKGSLFSFLDRFKENKCVCLTEDNCLGHPCISSQFADKISNDITNLEFYRDLKLSNKSLVAYTDDNAAIITPHDDTTLAPSSLRISNEPNLKLHTTHKDDHHHTINTPLSRILSLGFQTSFALTLHKFPEGFITYATSKADPKGGIAIFLSLAIHNIVEGFSMVLPLYLALNSRAKAFLITFILGGFSQPLGALVAYLVLNGKEIDTDESNRVFGVLIAITCGFLIVISLQLFASAINFGGSTNRVLSWCIVGMFVIQLSGVLTDISSFID